MKQDRLNGLGLLSIENAVVSELDYSSVIEKFASLKARRVIASWSLTGAAKFQFA